MSVPVCLSKVIRNSLFKKSHFFSFGGVKQNYSKIWEPNYLILAETKTPEYDEINVQIKGYDFVVLENYQSFIHKIARLMNIDVANAWATPHQDFKIQKFKPNSSFVENEYKLKLYERNVQVIDVKSHIMPLFIEAVVTACPPGVKLSVHEHTPEMDEIRYVPDFESLEIQKEIENIGAIKKKKK